MGRLVLDVPGCQLRAHGRSRSVLNKTQRCLLELSPGSSGSQQLHRKPGCSQDKWRLIDSQLLMLMAQNSGHSPICKHCHSCTVTLSRLRAAVPIHPTALFCRTGRGDVSVLGAILTCTCELCCLNGGRACSNTDRPLQTQILEPSLIIPTGTYNRINIVHC